MIDSDLTYAQPHAELVPGVIVGPWLLRQRWDRGSFGVVFKAERAGHPEAGPFALKVALTPDDPRFKREVTLLQSVRHSSVPRFEDRGWWKSSAEQDYPYVVMEWVKGVPLYDWARAQPRTSRQVLQVLGQLAGALACAHAAGGVHRDVKGDNILVTPEGRAVLVDWGCAMHLGAAVLTDGPLGPGTTSYRSPEALRWGWAHRMDGERYEPSGADDVYALGVTAWRLCTGTYPPAPEEGSGPQRRLFPPRELATVSVGLEQLLLACLHAEPRRRPPAASLVVALEAAARAEDAARPIAPTPAYAPTDSTSRPGPRRRVTLPPWLSWASAAVLAVALVLAMVDMHHTAPPPSGPSSWEAVAEARHLPALEAPDAGVGDDVLASAAMIPRDVMPYSTVGMSFPKKPFPGQKKPPCSPRSEREVLGACWTIMKMTPPCDSDGFEYEGECLRAVIVEPRSPTSEEPR